MVAELDAIARRQGVTRSEVMRQALATWLSEHADQVGEREG